MWGIRVVIPMKLRDCVLEELHDGHVEVVKMEGLARSHVWWPSFDKAIEEVTYTLLKPPPLSSPPPHLKIRY